MMFFSFALLNPFRYTLFNRGNKTTSQGENIMGNERISHLPAHLQNSLNAYYDKADKFGIDVDWASKAFKKAEKTGNTFNPIHGLIG